MKTEEQTETARNSAKTIIEKFNALFRERTEILGDMLAELIIRNANRENLILVEQHFHDEAGKIRYQFQWERGVIGRKGNFCPHCGKVLVEGCEDETE